MMPGFFLAMYLGVRGGPDGMPSIVYVFGPAELSRVVVRQWAMLVVNIAYA